MKIIMTDKSGFEPNEIVYVAHPYGGQAENKYKALEIVEHLQKTYPRAIFLSPLTIIGLPYNSVSHEEGMKPCLALLHRCDTLLLTGDWENSKGCVIEREFAKHCGIRIAKLNLLFDEKGHINEKTTTFEKNK